MPNHANASHDRTDLQPLAPADAVRLWIESHVDDWAVATRDLQSYHVEEFTDWLTDDGVDDMRDVSARTVHRFRLEIKNDLAQATLSQRISTVRRFLKFCVSVDAVAPSVPERIEIPKRDGNARTESLETDHAEAALSYLRRFAYASREHALLALTWHTGIRTGTVRALDVSDVETANNRLRVRHRPETDTPLKNGESAERYVTLSETVTEALADFIEHNRVATRDDHGREPLFTTENGRAPVKTLRRWFQTATRPCLWDECPHGRDPDDCDAAQRSRDASDCPSSVSGHPIRRGAITHHLRRDVPEKVVSDRCNVSADVLDEHYDRRSDDEKAEQRRSYLGNI
jgi:site-specific recombinase XerD